MKVEALNCPNCGAGVESDRSQCQFCKTRLKTVACPKCFGLMFVGSKFCGHCGAIAAPVEVSLDEESANCPRCASGLEKLQIGETQLHGCGKCDGLWIASSTFEDICSDAESRAAVLGFFDKRERRPQTFTKVNYVPCPECGQLMNRSNFARASGVIVDICKQHGVWFDADELPAIVEFIQKGGMELARQREKNDIDEARIKLRADQFQQTLRERRFDSGGVFDEKAAGIRKFVRILFD
jgi:Zn-finger nucleic acid-binding protein